MKIVLLVIDALGLKNEQSFGTLNRILKYSSANNFFSTFNICNKELKKQEINNINVNSTYITPSTRIPDSYLGHSEMIDARIEVQEVFITESLCEKLSFLSKYGEVRLDNGIILVGDKFVIGNNGECQPGLNLNILWLTKPNIGEKEMDKLAQNLLNVSNCTRVIQMWGNEVTLEEVYNKAIKERNYLGKTYEFLCIPPLNIYNEKYQVKHFGKEATNRNLLETLAESGINIQLIGKVGKMFTLNWNNVKINYSGADTQKTINELIEHISNQDNNCFIFCNIQEIDLAGHEQNIEKSVKVLRIISDNLMKIVNEVEEDDIIIITADHGNDPMDGSTFHSYEDVPLIILSKKNMCFNRDFGISLREIAYSIERVFGLKSTGKELFYSEN